ncbi:MAG TPA: hypothetical protein VNG33_13420 [Polyangiaceae bacterium]|nr:hypothetical protein [Polyangiaceae bacterium]
MSQTRVDFSLPLRTPTGQRGGPVAGFFQVLLALWAIAGPAAAQPVEPPPNAVPEQVQLQYVSGQGCPSRSAFVDEVAARIRRPIEWVETKPAFLISVTLEQTDARATGRLEVVHSGSEPTRREFTASQCSEVSSALALVTALTLDPNARTEPLPPPSAPAAEAPPPAPAPAAPPVAPSPPAPPPARRAEISPPAPTSAREKSGYVAWLGPASGVAGGYASAPLVTFGLSLGARVASMGPLAPSLQLTPLYGKTGATGPSAAGGTFAWAMARLEACPSQFPLAASLALVPCAAGEVGRLSARGSGAQIEPVSQDRWWVAGGVTLSLHLALGRWFARLGGQALLPATRDEFVFFNPDRSVHQATFVYGATLSVGFELGQ